MLLSSIYIFLLGFTYCVLIEFSCSSSEFSLDGDYLLGGLFPVHEVEQATSMFSPEAIECFRHTFSKSGYQMFQVMRFAVEEINNSTTLLPNVSLGYEIFDHCSDTKNFPSVFNFISRNGSIKPQEKLNSHQPKVIALTGPYGSTKTLTIVPLVSMDLIPMVCLLVYSSHKEKHLLGKLSPSHVTMSQCISLYSDYKVFILPKKLHCQDTRNKVNYGASSYALSNKLQYPSFVRTIPSNKDLILMIIHIIQWFEWNWVAFLGSPDNYSEDGLQLFNNYLRNTGICLAYQEALSQSANYSQTLKKIDKLNINVIVVFTVPQYAKNIIKAAITNNIRDKVWIAGETWSMNQQLPREPGIEKIGTIIGITERLLSLPGFNEFIYKAKGTTNVYSNDNIESEVQTKTCNQDCDNCTLLTVEEIINEDPTFSFAIYTAIYTIAHALHEVLQCNMNECHKNTSVKPYMLLGKMRNLNFSLNGRQIKYDYNGDPAVSYAVVLWHTEANPPQFQIVGTYDTYPEIIFTINNSLLPWHITGSVPFSNCSVECKEGFSREPEGYHDCCFRCTKCPRNSYVVYSWKPCFPCAESEWSDEGSTICKIRSVVYLQFNEIPCIAVIFSAAFLITLLVFIFCLFTHNYNTPVVRSAGGSMCSIMLACLIMSSISVFFFFGKPTKVNCILRNFIFTFFFTVCLSCLAVRSFQIVCIFKMAAKFPKLHSLWVKHSGQWLFVALFSVIHFFLCVIWVTVSAPKPYRDLLTFKDQIILSCEKGHTATLAIVVFTGWFLGSLCILFSYMGRDLPKNYNEAKSITFSLILYYLSWIVYFTVFLIIKSKYIQLFNAMTQLSSIYGIVFSYFIPKSYIIIFQPEKNTAAYFQTSIQNYTQTIGRN